MYELEATKGTICLPELSPLSRNQLPCNVAIDPHAVLPVDISTLSGSLRETTPH